MFQDRISVAPLSYIKVVKAVYRQIIYYHLVQFSGMMHLLVTYISRQDQNFRNIPRIVY